MGDPAEADGPPVKRARALRSVPPPVPTADPDPSQLAGELAAALRAIRGYVPDRIWWEAGAAPALLAFQALHDA